MRILTRYILKEISSHSLLGLLVFTFVNLHSAPGTSVGVGGAPQPAASFDDDSVHAADPRHPRAHGSHGRPGGNPDRPQPHGGGRRGYRRPRLGDRDSSQFVRPVLLFAFAGWALTLWMSLFLSPQAARKLNRMETGLKASQAPYEIQPRVFIEQFPNLLLYLEDVTGSRSRWRGVFIADTTQRDQVKVTLAESGVLVNEAANDRLVIHLAQGMTHEIDPQNPVPVLGGFLHGHRHPGAARSGVGLGQRKPVAPAAFRAPIVEADAQPPRNARPRWWNSIIGLPCR